MSSTIGGITPSAADISGTAVTLIGTNIVTVSGNQVFISGQPVSISGNAVVISGQLVAVSGLVATSVSGNMVSVSGQAISVSGNAVRTSGDIAYLTSGQAPVFNYGFIDASGQWTQLRVTQSGQGISGIPHKLPVTFSGDSIIGSVSGNMVSVSGQAISISGNAVRMSGQLVAIGDAAGSQVNVTLGDGDTKSAAAVGLIGVGYNYGYDKANDVWARLRALKPYSGVAFSGMTSGFALLTASILTDESGRTAQVTTSGRLAVDAGAINVASNVSGNVVYLTSGQNNVQMSGETVRVISGDTLQTIIRGTAGNAAAVQANTIGVLAQTEDALTTAALAYALDTGNNWRQLAITVSGQGVSGINHKLVVTFSGESIIGSVSGNMVSVSGQPAYLVSGQNEVAALGLIQASGQLTNLRVTQSGQGVSGIPHKLVVTHSGDAVRIAGGSNSSLIDATSLNVDTTANTSNALITMAVAYANDRISSQLKRISAIKPYSGVAFSGMTSGFALFTASILTDESGNTAQVTTSGRLAVDAGAISVASNVSGNVVYLVSGQNNVQMSGQLVVVSGIVGANVSGNVVRMLPDGNATIRTASGLVCTSLSGGTVLPSLAADRITLRMDPDNSGRMYVGSTTNPPFSGMGFKLAPGDGLSLQVTNANVIQVFATTSGELVSFITEDT